MNPAAHDDTSAGAIARLRRTLLLLARNQSQEEQIHAAGRHIETLGALLRQQRDTEEHGDVAVPADKQAE